MKKLLGTTFLFALVLASCDKVDEPVPAPVEEPTAVGLVFPVIDSANIHVASRKVFVEEFTGHDCQGCPASTERLIDQQKNANDEIIVVSVHAGSFADVKPPKLTTDFKTPYGDELNTIYMEGAGYPSVLINRIDDPNGGDKKGVFTSFANWTTPIDDEIGSSASIGIGLEADYVADSNAFAISLAAQLLTDFTEEHRLVLLCLEDSVVDGQKDQRLNQDEFPGKINPEYVHKHVLRAHLNNERGVFGEVVIPATGLLTDEWFGGEYYYLVPENVLDPTNCSIVAYVINSNSQDIIQSEEVHVHVVGNDSTQSN